jgi:hypothetical protein
MPKLSLSLRKEPTGEGVTTETTFNSPGVYIPPYGKTKVLVGGKGASGNLTVPGTYAGTNPTTGGNYAGTYAPTGGNYAGMNPSTGGNYAGANPTEYLYMRNIAQNIDPGGGSTNGFGFGPGSSFFVQIDNIGTNTNVRPEPTSTWGFYNVNRPVGNVYQTTTWNTTCSQFLGLTYTNGVPAPQTANLLWVNVPAPPTYFYVVVQFNQLGTQGGNAYYNPTTPGNAYYNPTSPGFPYYNPIVPGTDFNNPTTPGTPGSSYSLGGVTLSGGAADTQAPVVLPTLSTLKYNGPSGISITVPTGGYVVITSKATNT